MKRNALIIAVLLSLCLCAAQDLGPWQACRHSSVDMDGNLHLRWESADPTLSPAQFWTRQGSGAWQMLAGTHLGGMSYEALAPYTWGQNLRWRLRTEMSMEGENVALMHAAWLDEDVFPPAVSKQALIGNDPAGDSLMIQAPMLDLGDTWMGTTDQKLFGTIANQSGSFPTMNSLTSYNVWLTTIANPEALADSVVYAMVYTFNIVGVISSGLYKLGMDETMTPTFERIGNIQTSVSGGRLNMACNWNDLTSDPGFGAWPNLSNSLLFSSLSMRLNLDLSTMEPELLIGDYSTPGIIYFDNLSYQVQQNTLPNITGLTVNGLFVSCQYQDNEGDFPLVCEFECEEGPTVQMQPGSSDFLGGVSYSALLSEPIQAGTLRVSDNNITVQEYEWNQVDVDDPNHAPRAISCVMPNPLRSGNPVELVFNGLDKGPVFVSIYNLRGQKLSDFSHDPGNAGQTSVVWDGLIQGREPAAGVYLLKVRQGSRVISRKFGIIK